MVVKPCLNVSILSEILQLLSKWLKLLVQNEEVREKYFHFLLLWNHRLHTGSSILWLPLRV